MVTKMLLFLQKISKNKLKMKDVIFSVLSSFIGIQSNKNREIPSWLWLDWVYGPASAFLPGDSNSVVINYHLEEQKSNT